MNLDDELLKEAHELTGIKERTTLIHEGLRSLIQKEAARRLILLGGSEPGARRTPRRREPPLKSVRPSGGGKRS